MGTNKSSTGVESYAPFSLDVVMALCPFEDNGINVPSGKADMILKSLIIPATRNTEKIEFTMPDDKGGFVYCKWRPHDTSIADTGNWYVDLKLDNCGTYTRMVSD